MKIRTCTDIVNLILHDTTLTRKFTPYGISFGKGIDISFKGKDHMTFRFDDEYDLEPMRVKRGCSMTYDVNSGLIIINDKVAIKVK